MALFEKLVGTEQPKLSVHTFVGSLHLWAHGLITRAQLVASYGLDAADDADLDFLKNKHDAITGAGLVANKTEFIAMVEMLLFQGEDGGRFGLNDKATFVAVINQL